MDRSLHLHLNRTPTPNPKGRALLAPFLYTALRILTAGLSPVPGAVAVDPLPILLARDGGGVRGLLYLPGLIVGDLLAGMGPGVMLVRLTLVVFFCLWSEEGGFHRSAWVWTFQFALVSGIAVDIRGLYPLGFVTLFGVIQGFLWWGLLAPRAGGGGLRPVWPLFFPPAALLAVLVLLPSPPLWPLPSLADHSSGWVIAFSIVVLLEPWLVQLGRSRTLWDRVGRLMKRRQRDP